MNKLEQKAVLLQSLLDNLVNLGHADTLYRDLYILRARFYLERELSQQDYLDLKSLHVREASLPNQIRNAMNRADWNEVHELSGRYKSLQDELENKKTAEEYAQKIYDYQETPIDPFSPGMHKIAGFTSKRLSELRNETIRRLKDLSKADSEWKEFYLKRLAVFTALTINTAGLDEPTLQVSATVLEEEAAQALVAGNMARLELLAEKLLKAPSYTENSTSPADLLGGVHKSPEDYRYAFPSEVLKKAAALGLELFSVPSRSAEFAPFSRFAWHPTFSDLQGNHSSVLQVPDLKLPKELPEALKARIQLFAIHPFINSAGVRFLPNMLAEDVLVEAFPEPEAGSALPSSGLLEALGIKQRNQFSRQQIEVILMEKGSELLRDELGLDPREFKLVCIPADLHLRIGQERGWGQQKIWTHFDGYMIMADGKRQALAGGDVRYGGIYDLLGLNCSYDSERIISRFAVVQRCRMAVWQ